MIRPEMCKGIWRNGYNEDSLSPFSFWTSSKPDTHSEGKASNFLSSRSSRHLFIDISGMDCRTTASSAPNGTP